MNIHQVSAKLKVNFLLGCRGSWRVWSEWVAGVGVDLAFHLDLARHAADYHDHGHGDVAEIATVIRSHEALVVLVTAAWANKVRKGTAIRLIRPVFILIISPEDEANLAIVDRLLIAVVRVPLIFWIELP